MSGIKRLRKSPPLPYITLHVCDISRVTPQMYQYCIIAQMLLLRWVSFFIQIYAHGEVYTSASVVLGIAKNAKRYAICMSVGVYLCM